ncbi:MULTISPECIES: hypothetical protein [Streptomyces]|uniref:hypothetical protein n=1 Tax=Streptomyces TaxID=1883 RepID=UPI000A3678A0
MKINWNGNHPVSTTGAGCVINAPAHGGFGFRRPRVTMPTGIITKIGITLGSVALAGVSALGLIQLGYEEHTATAVTVAAGKVGAATITALVVADRRRKRKKKPQPTGQHPAAEPQRRVPPSAPATADEQPGGAN